MNPIRKWLGEQYHETRRASLERYYSLAAARGRLRGTTAASQKRPIIVSLTSIPSRLKNKTALAVASLLDQSFKPDHVVLWLSDELRHAPLPEIFQGLIAAGLRIEYREDLGPHTKLVHTLREYPDAVAVTADDDCLYTRGWLAGLHHSYLNAPDQIHCWRAHGITKSAAGEILPYAKWDWLSRGNCGPNQTLFQTGVGGVLYPPGSLPEEVLNVSAFRAICATNDDIWFKGMALLGRTPVRKVRPRSVCFPTIGGSQSEQLWNINSTANDIQIRNVWEKYDLFDRI